MYLQIFLGGGSHNRAIYPLLSKPTFQVTEECSPNYYMFWRKDKTHLWICRRVKSFQLAKLSALHCKCLSRVVYCGNIWLKWDYWDPNTLSNLSKIFPFNVNMFSSLFSLKIKGQIFLVLCQVDLILRM